MNPLHGLGEHEFDKLQIIVKMGGGKDRRNQRDKQDHDIHQAERNLAQIIRNLVNRNRHQPQKHRVDDRKSGFQNIVKRVFE